MTDSPAPASPSPAPAAGGPTRVDMWFDPICPWAWMTSRWLLEVAARRDVDLAFHQMSLFVLNEGRNLDPGYRAKIDGSLLPGRVVAAAIAEHGEDVAAPLYTALGTRIHLDKLPYPEAIAGALAELGLPAELAAAGESEAYDEGLRASHAGALALAGPDAGTPVVALNGVGFFGPVVTPAPTGQQALDLFDGLRLVTGVPGFYELKRHRTDGPQF